MQANLPLGFDFSVGTLRLGMKELGRGLVVEGVAGGKMTTPV
jgi:hypothetical protein